MVFKTGHKFHPRKGAYVRPHDIPGAVIHKVPSPPQATGNVWGSVGATDDVWPGTYRDPFDITPQKPKVHPWAVI